MTTEIISSLETIYKKQIPRYFDSNTLKNCKLDEDNSAQFRKLFARINRCIKKHGSINTLCNLDKCILWRTVFKQSPILKTYIKVVEKQKTFRLNWQSETLICNNTGPGTGKLTIKEQIQTMQLYHKWTYEANRLELLLKEKRNVDLREQIECPI